MGVPVTAWESPPTKERREPGHARIQGAWAAALAATDSNDKDNSWIKSYNDKSYRSNEPCDLTGDGKEGFTIDLSDNSNYKTIVIKDSESMFLPCL